MNTLEFLQTILPEEGWKFLALGRPEHSGLAHKAYESLEKMAEAIDSYDRQPTLTVYHACAAYKEASYEVEVQGKMKRKYRGEPNWFKAKSFWVDIDCGESKAAEGKGYATKGDAAKALFSFCHKFGFPEPMVVDSGGGLHCYWPLTQAIGPKSWNTMATGFKAALKAEGVLADPTRTADLSSVLRPAGSTNKKPGREPRPVRVKRQANPCTPAEFAAAVAMATADLTVPVPTRKYDMSVNDDLTAHLGPQIESSAREVAEHCAQLAQMRDTLGQIGHDHWFHAIGIIKHCVEGIELAHEWSAGPTYDPAGVDTKYESFSSGPSLCTTFELHNPSACASCPHRGKISSPIQLGRIVPEPAEQVVEVQTEDDGAAQLAVPPLPSSYAWGNGKMVRLIADKDGVLQQYVFCHTLFYPIQRIRKPDGTFAFTMRMHLPDYRVRDFEVDTAAIAATSDLLKALGKYELMPTNNKDASMHLTAYIRDSIHKLMHEQREVDTLTNFGWRDDMSGFLLGERLYGKDGSIRKVFVGGAAADKLPVFTEPRGTLARYSEAVNFVYNRPHNEAAQYVFCNTYGSLISPLGDPSYFGVLLCVTGEGGLGKTTAGVAARYGLGNARHLVLGKKDGATANARWKELGTYRNIPVLLDEYTDVDAETLSSMAYTISQGADKSRLTSHGGKVGFAERQTWCQSPEVTSNDNLLARLAQHNANTLPEAMRMVQVNFTQYGVTKIKPTTDVERALDTMDANSGNAGHEFVQYVVTHQEEVSALIRELGLKISSVLPDSMYRFYRGHASCTLAAAKILIDLGIVQFDYDALEHFAMRLFKDLSDMVLAGNVVSPGDAISRMIREMSSRIIVTVGYRDLRTDSRGPEDSLSRITASPVGRRVLGVTNPNASEKVDPKVVGKLFMAKKEFNEWCTKNRLEPKSLLDYAGIAGWLVPWSEKFNIGRGTAMSTGACSVYVFDYNAMEGAVEKTSGPALVDTDATAVSSTR